jgi:putative transposase
VEWWHVACRTTAQHQSNLPLLCPCIERQRQTQAKFLCVACGYENHADVVGAINVLERGYRLLACGESVQSGRSMKQEPTEATTQITA